MIPRLSLVTYNNRYNHAYPGLKASLLLIMRRHLTGLSFPTRWND